MKLTSNCASLTFEDEVKILAPEGYSLRHKGEPVALEIMPSHRRITPASW